MLFTVATALMYVERRRLVDVFPDSIKKIWNDWELRVLILLSLISQIILIFLGNRRKFIPRTRIRIILWSAYLMADWVATVALGVISKNSDCDETKGTKAESTKDLMSFWAPFLLLHLGGPDTITAYSLEDNELWLRHLVGLFIQTGVALYIFLEAWDGSWLSILSLFVLDVGLVKFGERTWSLRAANSEQLRESMLTQPDAGPNYAKFMEIFTLKKAEGFHVKADEVIEIHAPTDKYSYPPGRGKLISEAYDFFQTFKRLFVDLILSFQDRENSQSYFLKLFPEDAFHVVEIELGFAYDLFYSKAFLSHTLWGCILRLISLSCTSLVLLGFVFLVEKKHYHIIDLIITYLLLGVAVVLDLYSLLIMLCSEWMDYWLTKHNKTREFLIISCLQQPKKIWWCNSMAQYNLLSVCFKEKPAMFYTIQKFLGVNEYREKHRYKTYNNVSSELKVLIFNQLKKFIGNNSDYNRSLCTCRRSFALLECDYPSDVSSTTSMVEFDQKILLWHIATDLCYYLDCGENPVNVPSKCQESKHISDYMLYLLVMYPFMLPIGIGMIRIRDTCAEAQEFLEERGSSITGKAEACQKLLKVNTEVLPAKVKGDRSKSVLFDACRLAKSLQKMEMARKWEIVADAWVGMLAFAATHCRGNHHAQQLRKGGELLTHVWLLMAHLGITDQFQIDQGHARPKLIVK